MKRICVLLILAFLYSCSSEKGAKVEPAAQEETTKNVEVKAFQEIIDSARVEGAILIFDPQEDTYYSNDFSRCAKAFLPASTFKIVNSIIALETGVVENDSTFFEWDGEKRALSFWERDMIFREAFHLSCVPCYQEIARNIGAKRMNAYLEKLDYGDMVVDSSNIDLFWLEGDSRISPNQQMNFIKRFYYSSLHISPRTEQIMKRMMVMEDKGGYKLSGKTGWAIRDGFNIGWFVAYMETEENSYFLVTNIEPKEDFNMEMFATIRKDISLKAFDYLLTIE